MKTDPENRRLLWRNKKRAQRERLKSKQNPPNKSFEKRIMDERNRRVKDGMVAEPNWRYSWYRDEALFEKAVCFSADVWASIQLIEQRSGNSSATPTAIARWLTERELTYGYAPASLRKMVYKARERIEFFETHYWPPSPERLTWKPFPSSHKSIEANTRSIE